MPDRPADASTDALLAQAGWVRGLALSLVGRQADADDAAQATWLAALEKPPALRSSPRAWLRSVLRNVVARSARRSDLRSQAETRHEQRPDPEGAGDVLQRAETHRKLVDHVMALPEPGRSTILMHYFDGLSLAEIARRLGVPTGTVRSRHHRAVEDLRARLGNERRDWRAMLLPIAAGPAALPAATAAGKAAAEIIAMTLKAKVGIAAAALLVIAVATLVITSRSLFEPRVGTGVPGSAVGQAADPAAAGSSAAQGAAARPLAPRSFLETEKVVLRGRVRSVDAAPLESIRLLVTRYDAPEPVEGDAADNPTGFPRVVGADAAGEFRVELGLAAPAFTVMATARGCAPRDVTVWADKLRAPVEIVLERGAVLAGTVQNLDRVPVPNARVALRWFAGGVSIRREGRSDPEGRYVVEGLPRPLESSLLLEAVADGFAPLKLTSLPAPDSRGVIQQDLFMTRGATIRGRVVDSDTGAPLPEARAVLWIDNQVSLVRKPDGSWMRNPDEVQAFGNSVVQSDGSFRFEHVPSWGVHPLGGRSFGGSSRPLGGVAAIAPGHAPRVVALELPTEGSTVDVVVRCKPAGQIRGRVVDPGGRPVPGALVGRTADEDENAEGWLPRGIFPFAPAQETTSDAEGRYVITGVPSSAKDEAPVRLSAWDTRWPMVNEASIAVAVAGASDVEAPDLVLVPDWRRSAIVRVRSEDGQPVWGAAILWSPHADVPVARTDRDGKALVRIEEPDVVVLQENGGAAAKQPVQRRMSVRAPGFSPQNFELTPSASEAVEATVTLHPGRGVSGTVVHPDGSPAAGASVLVTNVRLAASFPRVTVTSTGSFELSDLPPGPYDLTANLRAGEGDSDEWASTSLTGAPEGPGVKLVLDRPKAKPRAGLTVVCVEKATGAPVLKCNLELLKDEVEIWAHATAPGEFTFTPAEPGEWRLRVHPFAFASHEQKVTLEAGKTTRVVVAVEKGVVLKGRLRHPEGKPFNQATLGLIGSRQEPVLAADGSFEVTGLMPGSRIGFTVEEGRTEDTHRNYATRPEDFVTIPADRAEIAAEIPLVAGGQLNITIEAARLFWRGHTPTEAMRDLARRARLEIRDSQGAAILDVTGITDFWSFTYPTGRYTVRLEVPGAPAQERAVELGGRRVDLEFKVE